MDSDASVIVFVVGLYVLELGEEVLCVETLRASQRSRGTFAAVGPQGHEALLPVFESFRHP